jgi:hypothetical protein
MPDIPSRPKSQQGQKSRPGRKPAARPSLAPIRGDREFLLRVCTLRVDHPDRYERMLKLVSEHLRLFGEEEFRLRVSEIVFIHGRRLLDPHYEANIKNALVMIDAVILSLVAAQTELTKLDIEHLERLAFVLERLGVADFWTTLPHRKLHECVLQLKVLEVAIQIATAVAAKPGPGRPRGRYYWAALDFIELFEGVTRQTIKSPTGMAKGARSRAEATDDSTLFVQLGLQMVDDHVTAGQVRTAIETVINFRRDQRAPSEMSQLLEAITQTIADIRGGHLSASLPHRLTKSRK